jgi:hypothetical protein
VYIGTQGAGTWTVTWYFSTGAGTWSALSGVTDNTTGFTAAQGWKSVSWTAPSGWVQATYNGINAYWIKAEITAYTSTTTQPLGTQAALIGDVDVQQTVTVKVTTKLVDGTLVGSVRVLLEAASGGDLPSDASVSITRSGTTATVSHTGHGLGDGDKVAIRGANQWQYNGVKTITNIQTNSYDFTVSGTPDTPATGTITSTAVILDGTTDGSGIIQDASFNYSSSQPVRGKARKGTSSPYYRSTPLIGTITANGYDVIAIMTPDE